MQFQFDSSAWLSLLDRQIIVYPLSQVEDLYKCVFQAICGPEHLIQDQQAFLARLEAEYQATQPDASQLLWEPLRPDSQLGRIHLAAYKTSQRPLDALGAACLASAQQSWGTRTELRALWEEVEQAGLALRWPSFQPVDFQRFGSLIRSQGFGAIHHSERYRVNYRPAYRLVSLQEWQKIE